MISGVPEITHEVQEWLAALLMADSSYFLSDIYLNSSMFLKFSLVLILNYRQ